MNLTVNTVENYRNAIYLLEKLNLYSKCRVPGVTLENFQTALVKSAEREHFYRRQHFRFRFASEINITSHELCK